jgi:hypothetical protein
MIAVTFRKPADPRAFDDWVKRCKAKARTMTSAKEVSPRLYKEQREFILNEIFRGKCAYCEAHMKLDQNSGDVDHFRPKGRVTDLAFKVVSVKRRGAAASRHPGYFWLAHHWENLLPACLACNRPSTAPDGRTVGKSDRFPVIGAHAGTPRTVTRERPLLLNPLFPADNPRGHLRFDPQTGRIIGITDRGEVTVEVLNLNREGLPEARRDLFDHVTARATLLLNALAQGQPGDVRAIDYLSRVREGAVAYSMAARVALEQHEPLLQRIGAEILGGR